jgi:predicted PurR-regulated permease PerM
METNHLQLAQGKFDWNSLTLFLISICAILLCLAIAQPFIPAITGAVVLAIVTQRPHQWIAARLRNRTVAASTTLLLVILSIVVPAMFLAQGLGLHILTVIRNIQSGAPEQALREFVGDNPRVSELLHFAMKNVDINQAIENSAGSLAQKLGTVLSESVAALFQIVVMLFILFFLYRDKRAAISFVRSYIPLDEEETDYLLLRVGTSVQALVMGRFIVAAAQGLVAGISYACLGVGSAAMLGFTTMLFALIPAFGAFVIWLPIVVFLALAHHWIQAAILLAIGSLIISTLDNLLYPVLVGSKLQMHTVPIFLAMMGGVWFFGISGLVLGPIAFALTESLVHIWRKRSVRSRLSPESKAS